MSDKPTWVPVGDSNEAESCPMCGHLFDPTQPHSHFTEAPYSYADVKALVLAALDWQSRARELIDVLHAYDGAGIPLSDARDAFAMLRELRDSSALAPFAGMWEEKA